MIPKQPTELESNFPKVASAYNKVREELYDRLNSNMLKPADWQFPEIKVDLDFKYGSTFIPSKNQITFSGPAALNMDEKAIYEYIKNTAIYSQKFPSVFKAYERAINYTLENLHKIPNRRKDWEPPRLNFTYEYNPAGYSPGANIIHFCTQDAAIGDKDSTYHKFCHEIRHSLNKIPFLEKLLASRKTDTAFRATAVGLSLAAGLYAKMTGQNVASSFSLMAFSTTALYNYFNIAKSLMIPSDYITKSKGNRVEIECDTFSANDISTANAFIQLPHSKGTIGETKPIIENLPQAIKICSELYLQPDYLKKPRKQNLLQNLGLAPFKPKSHPSEATRFRNIIETITSQENPNIQR